MILSALREITEVILSALREIIELNFLWIILQVKVFMDWFVFGFKWFFPLVKQSYYFLYFVLVL